MQEIDVDGTHCTTYNGSPSIDLLTQQKADLLHRKMLFTTHSFYKRKSPHLQLCSTILKTSFSLLLLLTQIWWQWLHGLFCQLVCILRIVWSAVWLCFFFWKLFRGKNNGTFSPIHSPLCSIQRRLRDHCSAIPNQKDMSLLCVVVVVVVNPLRYGIYNNHKEERFTSMFMKRIFAHSTHVQWVITRWDNSLPFFLWRLGDNCFLNSAKCY